MRTATLVGWMTISLAVGSAVAPAYAHHSFPATYQVDQQVTIEGTVEQFMFRNPHSFIHVMATDKSGTTQRWAVEWGAGNALSGENIGNDTLKPGDKVVITGNPSRNSADRRIRLHSIVRPADGWKWSGTFG